MKLKHIWDCFYGEGLEVKKDYDKALYWYEKAVAEDAKTVKHNKSFCFFGNENFRLILDEEIVQLLSSGSDPSNLS